MKVRKVSAGIGHTAAIAETGELYTWGLGTDGQLGYPLS
jgi:alpha-tubulin suppressor-like RCC1 family protein